MRQEMARKLAAKQRRAAQATPKPKHLVVLVRRPGKRRRPQKSEQPPPPPQPTPSDAPQVEDPEDEITRRLREARERLHGK